MDRIESQFVLGGAIGVLVVDASSYAVIERSYGCEAHRTAMANLHSLVSEVAESGLGIGDMVLNGETGRG